MLTHKEAKSLFDECRNKSRGYLLAHKTHIHMRGRSCAVRLYNTDIVIIRPDGTYRINTGGLRTTTTKRRMNHVLPCVVKQQNGLWSIGDSFFQDGMLVGHDGVVVGEKIPLSYACKTKREVDRYCKKFIALVLDMCVTGLIEELLAFKKYHLPNHNNKKHLNDLWWNEILDAVNENKRIGRLPYGFYHRLMKWAYLSMIERGHHDNEWCWSHIRRACNKGDCYMVRHNLQVFMRKRKVNMTQMILDKCKTDADSPSVSVSYGISEKELEMT